MSFYQQYRPRQFGDILGQEQVIQILKNQASTGVLPPRLSFPWGKRHWENDDGQDTRHVPQLRVHEWYW